MKTSHFASVLAALLLGATGTAHATTLGLTSPYPASSGTAVWDSYTATQFSGLAPGSSSNVTTPVLNQGTTFTQFGQGAGLYNFLDNNPPASIPGTDLLFTGGNAVTFTSTGTFNFDVTGLTLQIKSASLSDVLFQPTLSINGSSAFAADSTGFTAGSGDTNTTDGVFRVYKYTWNTSLAGLTPTGTSSYTLSFQSLSTATGLPAAVTRSFDGVRVDAVPEPSTYAMIALGVGALAWKVRRRSKLGII